MITISPAADIARVYNLKPYSKGFYGPCPFHGGDNDRGLTVLEGDSRPVITCHTAGCNWKSDILPALLRDGLASNDGSWKPEPIIRMKTRKPAFKPIGQHETPTQPEALAIWDKAIIHHTEIYQHPYSQAKGIGCFNYGARRVEWRGRSTIVVPQYSLPGWEVCGVQLITGKRTDKGGWEKLNRGPRGIGKVGRIAKGVPLVVVEGWLDAIALWEQSPIKHPGIIIAFGGVMPVAENLDLYFKGQRAITAIKDNDQ